MGPSGYILPHVRAQLGLDPQPMVKETASRNSSTFEDSHSNPSSEGKDYESPQSDPFKSQLPDCSFQVSNSPLVHPPTASHSSSSRPRNRALAYLVEVAKEANKLNMPRIVVNPTNDPNFWAKPDEYEIMRREFHTKLEAQNEKKKLVDQRHVPNDWKDISSCAHMDGDDFETKPGDLKPKIEALTLRNGRPKASKLNIKRSPTVSNRVDSKSQQSKDCQIQSGQHTEYHTNASIEIPNFRKTEADVSDTDKSSPIEQSNQQSSRNGFAPRSLAPRLLNRQNGLRSRPRVCATPKLDQQTTLTSPTSDNHWNEGRKPESTSESPKATDSLQLSENTQKDIDIREEDSSPATVSYDDEGWPTQDTQPVKWAVPNNSISTAIADTDLGFSTVVDISVPKPEADGWSTPNLNEDGWPSDQGTKGVNEFDWAGDIVKNVLSHSTPRTSVGEQNKKSSLNPQSSTHDSMATKKDFETPSTHKLEQQTPSHRSESDKDPEATTDALSTPCPKLNTLMTSRFAPKQPSKPSNLRPNTTSLTPKARKLPQPTIQIELTHALEGDETSEERDFENGRQEDDWTRHSNVKFQSNTKDLAANSPLRPSTLKSIKRWIFTLPRDSKISLHYLCFYGDRDIAPRSWAEYKPLGSKYQTLEQFWKSYEFSAPHPIDEEDFDKHPWWKKYKHGKSVFLHPLTSPFSQLNPQDENFLVAKSKLSTAEHAISKKLKKLKEQTSDKFAGENSFDTENSVEDQSPNTYRKPVLPTLYQAQANLYLRLATDADLPQLKDIYNYYIEHSWLVPERITLNDGQMRSRLQAIQNKKWPWLVAVERSRGRRTRPHGQLFDPSSEKVLGFAYADDHHSPDGALRFTCSVQTFVASEYQNLGVGNTLIDRLLFCLEANYQPTCNAEYRCTAEGFAQPGGQRKVHRILASFLHAPGSNDETRARWMTTWLEKFGFLMYGEECEVGCKKNFSLDQRLFARKCSKNIVGFRSAFGEDGETDADWIGGPDGIVN